MVTREQLKDPQLERKVATILARIHTVPIPDDMPRKWQAKEGLRRCLQELPEKISDPKLDEWYQANFAGKMNEYRKSDSCN